MRYWFRCISHDAGLRCSRGLLHGGPHHAVKPNGNGCWWQDIFCWPWAEEAGFAITIALRDDES